MAGFFASIKERASSWLFQDVVLYEVNLTVEREIADEYAAWLGPHIREIMALDEVAGASWWRVDDPRLRGDRLNDPDTVSWCVKYEFPDRKAYQSYLNNHAERLRGDGLERFGGRFKASRRVMTRKNWHS